MSLVRATQLETASAKESRSRTIVGASRPSGSFYTSRDCLSDAESDSWTSSSLTASALTTSALALASPRGGLVVHVALTKGGRVASREVPHAVLAHSVLAY